MEAQQTDQESGNGKPGSFLCRQTSTRWTPTADQIRILKDLYYNSGLRSPTTEQIQRISARLRQYGKIEGKNVFYWFQNHKARERQKKRTSSTNAADHHHHHALPMQRSSHPDYYVMNRSCISNQDHPIHTNYSCLTQDGLMVDANGQMGNCGYESMTMERHFRDCSISPPGSSSGFDAGNINCNLTGWVRMDQTYSQSCHCFYKRKPLAQLEGTEEEGTDLDAKITLPLFPMHREGHHINGAGAFASRSDGRDRSGGYVNHCPCACLELSLNSCTRASPDCFP